MRAVILFFIGCACSAAEIEFVGVMANSTATLFALRDTASTRTRWASIGDEVGGFAILSYDPKAETLTLSRGDERVRLKLPESKVQMSRDEVVDGLARVLGVSGQAQTLRDLFHPKLRALFSDQDLDRRVFDPILSPGSKTEIREIPEEFAAVLKDSLIKVEKAVGVRPTHGLWVEAGGHLSMTFVVQVGNTWVLAPSVPGGNQ